PSGGKMCDTHSLRTNGAVIRRVQRLQPRNTPWFNAPRSFRNPNDALDRSSNCLTAESVPMIVPPNQGAGVALGLVSVEGAVVDGEIVPTDHGAVPGGFSAAIVPAVAGTGTRP